MTLYNFSAGPAMLPPPVVQDLSAELAAGSALGVTAMEWGHRGPEFGRVLAEAEEDLRTLLTIPAEYRVLFLAGGATTQFALVPLNLMGGGATADYLETGVWSRKALREAQRYVSVRVVASSARYSFDRLPPRAEWVLDPAAAYLHLCTNETIDGLEFHQLPDTGAVPLVADMSSHFLARPLDVSRFGVIYAGAQKNAGVAGLTVLIVREDLLDRASALTPSVLHWQQQAQRGSLLNTPPTWAIYVAGRVFKWLLAEGGLAAIEQRNIAKARLLYDCIDASAFYHNRVQTEDRSRMNVPFTLRVPAREADFLAQASAAGLLNLAGHRSVGGLRASIYNAMPVAGVQALVDFMREFERNA